MTNSFFLLHRLLTRLFFFLIIFFYVATLLYGFYSFRFAVATFLFRASYNIFFYVSPLLLELSTSKFRRVRSLDGLLSLSLSLSASFFFLLRMLHLEETRLLYKVRLNMFQFGRRGREEGSPHFWNVASCWVCWHLSDVRKRPDWPLLHFYWRFRDILCVMECHSLSQTPRDAPPHESTPTRKNLTGALRFDHNSGPDIRLKKKNEKMCNSLTNAANASKTNDVMSLEANTGNKVAGSCYSPPHPESAAHERSSWM